MATGRRVAESSFAIVSSQLVFVRRLD